MRGHVQIRLMGAGAAATIGTRRRWLRGARSSPLGLVELDEPDPLLRRLGLPAERQQERALVDGLEAVVNTWLEHDQTAGR